MHRACQRAASASHRMTAAWHEASDFDAGCVSLLNPFNARDRVSPGQTRCTFVGAQWLWDLEVELGPLILATASGDPVGVTTRLDAWAVPILRDARRRFSPPE